MFPILGSSKREDIDVSQFMMCKSKSDLKQYGGKRIYFEKENRGLYQSVLNKYYPNAESLDIWVIEGIHNLCDEVLDYHRFISSELYHILNDLYDLCEWIIMWYGGEYDDLEEICTKEELIDIVKHCIEAPCCEIYVQTVKKKWLRDKKKQYRRYKLWN